MRASICAILVISLACQIIAAKQEQQDNKSSNVNDDRKTGKRGAVEIQGVTAYATSAPALAHVSHGPTILPAVTATPGIVYAPEKQVITASSPSQLYAKPSPHIAKISDAVLAGQQGYSGLIANQLYSNTYHPIGKVGYSSPSYAVSAPIPAQLAYSKHQVFTPQVYAHHQPQVLAPQPQVHYAHVQPQQLNYVQPAPYHNLVHPHQQHLPYVQPQVYQHPAVYHQPQVFHQPQVYHQQPLAYHHQPQATIGHAVVAQPLQKVAYAQPLVQPAYHAQPVLNKGEGAISYASFSQGTGSHVPLAHQQAKLAYTAPAAVLPAQHLLAKQVVATAPQQVYHHHQPQQYYQPQPHQLHQVYQQDYATLQALPHLGLAPKLAAAAAYPQPQVTYATQYFGKIAHGSPIAYSGYNH